MGRRWETQTEEMGSGGIANVPVSVILAESEEESAGANQVEGFSLPETPTRQDGAAQSRGQILGASKGVGRGQRQDVRISNDVTMAVSIY